MTLLPQTFPQRLVIGRRRVTGGQVRVRLKIKPDVQVNGRREVGRAGAWWTTPRNKLGFRLRAPCGALRPNRHDHGALGYRRVSSVWA